MSWPGDWESWLRFLSFSSVFWGGSSDGASDWATTVSFHLPSSSLLTVVYKFWVTGLYTYLYWYKTSLMFSGNRSFFHRGKAAGTWSWPHFYLVLTLRMNAALFALTSSSVRTYKQLCSHLQAIYCIFFSLLRETNSMKTNPSWEADSSSASQEISRNLLSLKFHYIFHKSP